MKSKKLFLIIAAGLTAGALFFTGCNKDETQDFNEDLTAAVDNTEAERIFNNVSNIADEAYEAGSNYKSTSDDFVLIGQCATITLDTTSFPHVLTINFGDENCLCPDGRYRRGKIIVSFTGRYRAEGTVITHTFENYFVNNHQVLGSKIVTNKGRNEMDNLYFTIEVDGQVIKPDGGEVSWDAYREREWIEGEETFRIWDDVYLITGYVNGTTAAGYSYNMTITEALRREIGCRYFVSGIFDFTPQDRPTRTVDYGDGACDNIATVTINGRTWTIYLR